MQAAPVGAPVTALGQPAIYAAQPVFVNESAQPATGQIVYAQPMQPQAQTRMNQPMPGQWRDGPCSCFSDCNSLLLGMCCPCFSFANTLSQTKLGNYHRGLSMYIVLMVIVTCTNSVVRANETCVAADDDSLSKFDDDDRHYKNEVCTMNNIGAIAQLVGSIASITLFFTIMNLRKKFRQTFEIQGSCCEDCCFSFFCQCCVLAQMDRHLTTSQTAGGCVLSDPGPSALLNQEQAVVTMAQPFIIPNGMVVQSTAPSSSAYPGTVVQQQAVPAQYV